jgi:hypothetical protein
VLVLVLVLVVVVPSCVVAQLQVINNKANASNRNGQLLIIIQNYTKKC